MKHTFGLIIGAALLTGCNEIPAGAYFNRGDPENLLDLSSEVVNMNLSRPGTVTEIAQMVEQDPPTRAELSCSPAESRCAQVKEILERHAVPAEFTGSGGDITLVYERVIARDCENRVIDNSINPYNLNHPTFGCSVTGNMVQQVSDKRQFTSPNLLDFQDGEKAVQTYRRYIDTPSLSETQGSGSAVQGISSSGGQ